MIESQDRTVDGTVAWLGLSADTSSPERDLLAAMVSSNGHGHLLAERLLSRFGSVAAIAKAHPVELALVEGIGRATATRMAAAFRLAHRAITLEPPTKLDDPSDIAAAVAPLLRGRTRERLVLVICNRAQRVIGYEILSEGSADRALLPLREAIVAVLRRDGQAFAVGHNHPSGNPVPSSLDVDATADLKRAAEATGLKFLGHVVVTDTGWRSVPNRLSWAPSRTDRPATC